jgi:protein TonB
MSATAENKNKFIAIGFTMVFHVLLFLLFIFMVFVTPIPPFEIKQIPEVEMDLGTEGLGNADAGGSGNHDKDIKTSDKASVKPIVNNDAPHVITDDTEPSTVVKTNPKITKNNTAETPKIEEPKPSSELLSALAALKNKHKHEGEGEGDGHTGGSGTGDSKGVGPGGGTGHGDKDPGFNGKGGYDLKGRLLIKKPEHMTDSQEEGIVVVEIIVDETGKVIKATPGQRGSTTTSSNLYGKARQAAYQAKFNPSPEGIKEQRGTYTFVFTLE